MESKPLTEKERLDALVYRLGISIRKLAQIVEMNENTFYHISDNSRFGISERTASKICYNLEKKMNVIVNRKWLMTGVGDMIIEKRSNFPFDFGEGRSDGLTPDEEVEYGTNYQAKYFALLEEYTRLQREHNELLKKMLK
jgi:DNA-binding Xre family transcriptional regulator